MKNFVIAGMAFTLVTVFAVQPAFAQDKTDKKLEKKIEKLSEELAQKMEDLGEKISELLDEKQRDANRDLDARQKNLQKRTERLHDRLKELETEESSEEKQLELESLKEELQAAEAEMKALEAEAEEIGKELEDAQEVSRYVNDKVVEEDETIPNKVMVINGNLTVMGKVEGDAVAVNGDVNLKKSAVINGDVVSVGGKVNREDGSKVSGTISEVKSDTETMDAGKRHSPKKPRGGYTSIDPEKQAKNLDSRWGNSRTFDDESYWYDDSQPQVAYNRADGFYLGYQKGKNYNWHEDRQFAVHGFLGYSFGNQKLQYKGAFDRWINDDYRTEIGVAGYSFTEAKDDWKISQFENTIMGLLAREDFLDWYNVKGVSFHLSQYFTPDARITVEYQNNEYASLENSVQWSLFGGDKQFRLNPAIQDGESRAIVISGELDKVSDFGMERKGVYLKTSAELAGGGLKGDFDYNRFQMDLRGYTSFSEYDNLNARLRIGTGDGNIPLQKLYEIGGPGSLSGFRTNEFAGNRMALLSIENLIHSEDLREELPVDLNLLLFTDIGYINAVKPGEKAWDGFSGMKLNDLKNSIGFGFASDDDDFRFTLGWRTDKGGDPVQLMVRFRKPF
ncbi:MAG: BamA/TamA family outer membrane protein [Bacteroidetes bacterium]|nr:BamA/TamA family outer membrane protein [Bacteroidota bacterium]